MESFQNHRGYSNLGLFNFGLSQHSVLLREPHLRVLLPGPFSLQILQEKGPPPGPERGLCLMVRNKLFKETHVMTKQEILLRRGAWAESSREKEPRTTLPQWLAVSGFYGDGISFWVVSRQSFCLRVLPGGALTSSQARRMPKSWILELGRTYRLVSPLCFQPLLISLGWC